MNVEQFVQLCRELAVKRGKIVPSILGGGMEFHDGGLRIHESENSSLVITLYYGDQYGKPTINNPVIMVDEKGKMYRCHDEWKYGIARLRSHIDGDDVKGLIDCPNYYTVFA